MKKRFLETTIERKDDKIVIVASDDSVDRMGDTIPIDSWDLRRFKKSPRLMVDHRHLVEKIVGRAVKIKIDKKLGQLTFEPDFHGITQLSKDVEEMVKTGNLNTVSVGFIHHPKEEKKDLDKNEKFVFEGKNELIEISFVTVPAPIR